MDNMDMSNPRTSPYAPIMTGQVTSPRVLDDVDKIGLARVPTPFISKANTSDIIAQKEFSKNMPAQYKLRRFYLPSEVAEHNTKDNCWASKFNQVFDLTKLIQENWKSELCDPIVINAGYDITHWFNKETHEPITFIDPETNMNEYLCPTGRYLHIPPKSSHSDTSKEVVKFEVAWWNDADKYMIGRLTKHVRKIILMNTLTKDEQKLEVASEETLNEILDRYMQYNVHAASYTWKRLGKVLDMNKTLQENGIVDEAQECIELGLDPEEYIPVIHLYFDDDLTYQ